MQRLRFSTTYRGETLRLPSTDDLSRASTRISWHKPFFKTVDHARILDRQRPALRRQHLKTFFAFAFTFTT